MLKLIILFTIKFYQKTLSPDHGFLKNFFPYGVCRFRPSCSEYTYQKITEFGIIKGSLMGLVRLFKCH